ncbi:MAG: response regulator [Desulfobacterales bacterium]|jgi:CheY-like chemotaxis protein
MSTILVIDDETATLTMFRLFLSAYGYHVLTAEDGPRGLQLFDQELPPIVFTDLKMPVMDGFDVIRAIKKKAPATEVVVITGHGDMDLVLQALNLEATDFINKPIERQALDTALARVQERLQDKDAEREQLTLKRGKSVAVIMVAGKLRGTPASRLKRLAHDIVADQCRGVVFSFDPNLAVTGTGITSLTQVLSDCRQARLDVAFAGLPLNLQTVFEMLGVTRYVQTFTTESEAVSALRV